MLLAPNGHNQVAPIPLSDTALTFMLSSDYDYDDDDNNDDDGDLVERQDRRTISGRMKEARHTRMGLQLHSRHHPRHHHHHHTLSLIS